jgi:uncharacterized phage protein (predicted DNA packaging)
MANIKDDHLKILKKRLRVYHSHEDDLIKSLLQSSYDFISGKCGDFDMDDDRDGAELVYNRARFDYNNALEYFDDAYMSLVVAFSLKNLDLVGTESGEADG